MINFILKTTVKILLVAVIATQVFGGIMAVQSIPKAEAIAPTIGANAAMGATAIFTSVPELENFSWHKFLDDVFKQVSLGIAYAMAQHFMQRFVNKLTEKYKIRNFLYYDQVLSNYYLNNFLRDKISDPDLRQIYVLLESGYVTGQPTGTTPGTGPDPRQALIPRLKRAITDLYIEETGIDPYYIANPPPDSDLDKYAAQAQYFYFNNPGYTESNVRANFGEFQSNATTAAQLEVIVGNGLKAGRFIGGWCEISILAEADRGDEVAGVDSNISTPQACEANGGIWRQSALDQARSFIDNPTAYVDKWMGGFIESITKTNFDPNNYWFVIGNAFGRFLTNRLMIDKPNGVLNEDPRGYAPSDPNLGQGNPGGDGIDIDGDGQADGYDLDGDGQMDTCIFGGTAPTCTGSTSITNPQPTAPCGNLLTGGSTLGQSDVRAGMDAVLPAWADSTDVAGFRNAVVDWLNSNGFEAAAGWNGNCNSSDNNLAIKVSPDIGVMYEIARDGAGCSDEPNPTMGQATPCRPLDGYMGQWSYVGQGIRP
jgi:hypothetical protein